MVKMGVSVGFLADPQPPETQQDPSTSSQRERHREGTSSDSTATRHVHVDVLLRCRSLRPSGSRDGKVGTSVRSEGLTGRLGGTQDGPVTDRLPTGGVQTLDRGVLGRSSPVEVSDRSSERI